MQIGDLYTNTFTGGAYIVKSYHPNPKRILLLDLSDGRVFSILKSILRTAYESSAQETQ